MTNDHNLKNKLLLYNCLFVTALLISNVLAYKIVVICGLAMPSATIGYAITYLMTDVVGELYGKQEANNLVKRGFWCLLIALLLSELALALPSEMDTSHFDAVFSQTYRIVLGSLTAYLCSQFIDVYLFHKIKLLTQNKYKFIRNNISTIISQFIDTTIFSFIAFYGTVSSVWSLIIGIYIAKVLIALCDTPFFYFLTKNTNKND